MAPESPPLPPRNEGYEKRDANARWIFGIIAGLFVAVGIAEAVLHWTKTRLEREPLPADAWTGARHVPAAQSGFGNFPRLQISSPEDLAQFRAKEDMELNTYGWLNKTAGVVRIPVARAVELVAERGLPVRAGISGSRLGPTPLELQQQRTNSTEAETVIPR